MVSIASQAHSALFYNPTAYQQPQADQNQGVGTDRLNLREARNPERLPLTRGDQAARDQVEVGEFSATNRLLSGIRALRELRREVLTDVQGLEQLSDGLQEADYRLGRIIANAEDVVEEVTERAPSGTAQTLAETFQSLLDEFHRIQADLAQNAYFNPAPANEREDETQRGRNKGEQEPVYEDPTLLTSQPPLPPVFPQVPEDGNDGSGLNPVDPEPDFSKPQLPPVFPQASKDERNEPSPNALTPITDFGSLVKAATALRAEAAEASDRTAQALREKAAAFEQLAAKVEQERAQAETAVAEKLDDQFFENLKQSILDNSAQASAAHGHLFSQNILDLI